MAKAETICVIGDAHFPHHHKPTLTKILEHIKKTQPDHIIQIGDLYDMLSFTRFARSHDIHTPKQEVSEARICAEEMWKICKKYSPKSKCYQILGNHDSRPISRLMDKFPEIASLVDIGHLWEFEGVKTVHDHREELVINGIIFMHGYRSKLGDHAKYNFQSTVCGHSHRGGVIYFPVKGQTIFELNAGFCADPESAALSYSKQKITNWTLGFGVIDDLGPRFVPL